MARVGLGLGLALGLGLGLGPGLGLGLGLCLLGHPRSKSSALCTGQDQMKGRNSLQLSPPVSVHRQTVAAPTSRPLNTSRELDH